MRTPPTYPGRLIRRPARGRFGACLDLVAAPAVPDVDRETAEDPPLEGVEQVAQVRHAGDLRHRLGRHRLQAGSAPASGVLRHDVRRCRGRRPRAARCWRSASRGSPRPRGSSSGAPDPSEACSQPSTSTCPLGTGASGCADHPRTTGIALSPDEDRCHHPVAAPSVEVSVRDVERALRQPLAGEGHRLAEVLPRERVVAAHHLRQRQRLRAWRGRAPRPRGRPPRRRTATPRARSPRPGRRPSAGGRPSSEERAGGARGKGTHGRCGAQARRIHWCRMPSSSYGAPTGSNPRLP